MKGKEKKAVSRVRKPSLFARVVALIEEARQKVAAVANIAQVYTNFEIGRQIVEEEQGGKRRAEYGKKVVEALSIKLTARFGRGWSMRSLETIRKFYLIYAPIPQTVFTKSADNDSLNGVEGIPQTVFAELSGGKSATVLRKSVSEDLANGVCRIPKFTLSWSHYLLLMRIVDPVERAFYEREATQGNWSFRQLERMYRTSTFGRLQISKDKAKVRALMNRPAPDVEVAVFRFRRRLRVRRETFGVRRKGMRRETLDARMMGARHETLDASHASRLTSTTTRLVSRVSRPAKLAFAPQKGSQQ